MFDYIVLTTSEKPLLIEHPQKFKILDKHLIQNKEKIALVLNRERSVK